MITSIVRRKLLRIYIAIYAFFELIIHQVDIMGAYPKNILDDNKFVIHIRPPPSIK